MGLKVKILMGQMANTLGSGPWAYVFAASAASAAKCFHTEGPRGARRVGPRAQTSVWKHFAAEAAKTYAQGPEPISILTFGPISILKSDPCQVSRRPRHQKTHPEQNNNKYVFL